MQPLDDGKIGKRRLLAGEIMETLVFERMLDGAQPVRPFGMAEARVVLEAGGMGEKEGRGHEGESFELFIKHKHA